MTSTAEGGIISLGATSAMIYEIYFLIVTETKLHLIPFFIEGVDIVVQRSECTVAVQGRL